ncbi:hypothetical protein [Streptomyces sp. NBC_00454]|uniref:hypothetical protein n=1 Tax=Streptomyces sp. NBC_00454 TaxID=2975747 RepID=UPI0030E03892
MDLPEVLLEVFSWTGADQAFTSVTDAWCGAEGTRRRQELTRSCPMGRPRGLRGSDGRIK